MTLGGVLFVAMLAQNVGGSIQGIVVDATGAALPGVTIVIRNVATGDTREIASDDQGVIIGDRVAHDVRAREELRAHAAGQLPERRIAMELARIREKIVEFDRERRRQGMSLAMVHAAAPCPIEVKRAMIEWWGPILQEYYSSTEGIGMTMIDSAQWLEKPGSVGRPLLGVVRVCDEAGDELPAGEVGTVFFEREEIEFEYLGDPEKTRSAKHPGHLNWATTGDLGYLDEDGYLFLAQTDTELAQFHRNVSLQNALGVPSKVIGPDEAGRLVPGLRTDDLTGAAFNATDGGASPNDATQAYARRAREGGVTIREDVAVLAIDTSVARVGACASFSRRLGAVRAARARSGEECIRSSRT